MSAVTAWRMRIFMDASPGTGGQTEFYGFQPQNCGFATTRQGSFASTKTHVNGPWNKDHPEMNSVRDARRGCKTGKPIFLLFRLVESTLEGPPGRIRVSHASVTV